MQDSATRSDAPNMISFTTSWVYSYLSSSYPWSVRKGHISILKIGGFAFFTNFGTNLPVGYFNQYNDWLRAGRSVDRIPVIIIIFINCSWVVTRWQWGEIFRTCPDLPWGPPSLPYNRYRVFPGGKERPWRDADPSALLVPWSERVELYLYSPYEPYGLHRASVPVQG
jgi:hypothetical protein